MGGYLLSLGSYLAFVNAHLALVEAQVPLFAAYFPSPKILSRTAGQPSALPQASL